jgi:hypothetical protein
VTAAALLTWTLEDELEALLAGEADDCLVCGERVEAVHGRVRCGACRTVVEPGAERPASQLALTGGS